MTFEEFQSTRREIADLCDVTDDTEQQDHPGYIYEGDLWIEILTDRPGYFYLMLCNYDRISNDLESLEKELYEFGVSEEIIT